MAETQTQEQRTLNGLTEPEVNRLRENVRKYEVGYRGYGLRPVALSISDGGTFIRDIYHFKDTTVDVAIDAPTGVVDMNLYCLDSEWESKRREEFLELARMEK